MFRSVGRLITSAILLVLSGLMMAACRYLPGLAPVYRDFSRQTLAAISSVTGLLPFALWEVLLVLLALLFIWSVVYTLLQKKKFLSWASSIVLAISLLVFLFVGLWGLNHYCPPLSEEIGLEVREYSRDELIAATKYYMAGANRYAGEVERDENNDLVPQDFAELAARAGRSFEPLWEQYPVLRGSTAPIKKAALTWYPMSWMGFTGVFITYTAESTVNPDTFTASLPYTMCHEAAHRCTVAAEDEANFAAFLACESSKDADFLYSGYYSAFVYCYNALHKVDKQAAYALWDENCELLRQDCGGANTHYDQYEGKVQDVAQQVNDTYRTTFSEESGVQSYGEVADYLIAYYLQKTA